MCSHSSEWNTNVVSLNYMKNWDVIMCSWGFEPGSFDYQSNVLTTELLEFWRIGTKMYNIPSSLPLRSKVPIHVQKHDQHVHVHKLFIGLITRTRVDTPQQFTTTITPLCVHYNKGTTMYLHNSKVLTRKCTHIKEHLPWKNTRNKYVTTGIPWCVIHVCYCNERLAHTSLLTLTCTYLLSMNHGDKSCRNGQGFRIQIL